MALNMDTGAGRVDLGEFLDREVYPALFNRLDTAFPEFGWKRRAGGGWTATTWPGDFPFTVQHENPDRLMVYANRPWWIKVHGHEGVRFLDLVNHGRRPSGPEFVEAVRKLADLAGVRFPEREVTPEEMERASRRDARRSALETVIGHCHEALLGPAGEAARTYLKDRRGLDDDAIRDLRLGLYTSVREVGDALRDAGHEASLVQDTALLWNQLEGYILFPWADAVGQPLTLYGRWPGDPPQGRPKTIALPGENTKASPLYFDRARGAGKKDVVLVEGVLDAALLQALGDQRVVACVAAQLSGEQVKTLVRYRVSSVTIALDPDGGGERGTLSCIRSLRYAGIPAFVAPRLPDGLDPDEFVLRDGMEAWKKHIEGAEHAFRYEARALVSRHRGEGWTDRSFAACLDEAIAFDSATTDPDSLTDLAQFFWPEVFEATGADFDAVNARTTAAREKVEAERQRRAYETLLRDASDALREGGADAAKDILRDRVDTLRREERHRSAEPVRAVADELDDHEAFLAQWRGKEFIGLPQRTLSKLDEMTLGLRGLMLLAAAPNVGKTTLAIQLGLDVVNHNDDAAFLFLSLEMSRRDMLTRMKSRLSGLDWKALVFGTAPFGGAFYGQEELQRLRQANHTLAYIGQRIRILDDKNFPAPTLEKVIAQVDDLKATSGASRVFVLVDYLQVWPVPDAMAKTIRTDLDADKWRIGQMKELRDAIGGDPVLVISEARKPSDSEDAWGGGMADVMGSARGTYTPDIVLLLRDLSDSELMARAVGPGESLDKKALAQRAKEERDANAAMGFSRQRLLVVKGRDGVQRGPLDLRFHFRQSKYEEAK